MKTLILLVVVFSLNGCVGKDLRDGAIALSGNALYEMTSKYDDQGKVESTTIKVVSGKNATKPEITFHDNGALKSVTFDKTEQGEDRLGLLDLLGAAFGFIIKLFTMLSGSA